MQSHRADIAKSSARAQAWHSAQVNRQCQGTRYNTSESLLYTLLKAEFMYCQSLGAFYTMSHSQNYIKRKSLEAYSLECGVCLGAGE